MFDKDYSTFYASLDRSNTYVGLDLGTPHVITSVAIAPRQDWEIRAELAVIEGANNADFSDAIALTIIPTAPKQNQMTTYTISCSKGFRYVRYVSPNNVRCNVAELAFYGYDSAGDNSLLPQLTNLPTVNIHTTDGVDITSRDYYLTGVITIISNNGTHFYTDSLSIRGRGNASWGFPKKPYKIKLNNKARLLGMKANAKDWTLINNYGDKTLIRNLLAFHISEQFQMAYTPQGRMVDVVLNGEYKGTYQLCDQIEVDKDRVNIEKMTAADEQLPNLAGGYFVEWDAYAYDEDNWFSTTRYGIPVTVKYPKADNIVYAQNNYLFTQMNRVETIISGSTYQDANSGHRSVMDSESFLKYQLIGELAGNTDTYWSVKMYKLRNDDKFYTGPVWDFDLGFENDNRTYPICSFSDFIYRNNGSSAAGVVNLVNRVMTDPYMVSLRKSLWQEARYNNGLTAESLLQVVDSLSTELYASQQLNFKRWYILGSYVHMNPRIYYTFEGEMDNVRNYIRNRFDWMDRKLDLQPKPVGVEQPSLLSYSVSNGIISLLNIEPGSLIRVIDMQGRELMQQVSQSNSWQAQLPNGIYLLILCIRGVGIKTYSSVHHLRVVFASLFTLY